MFRVSARPLCLRTSGINSEAYHCSKEQIECVPGKESISSPSRRMSLSMNGSLHSEVPRCEIGSSIGMNADVVPGHENGDVANSTSSLSNEVSSKENGSCFQMDLGAIRTNGEDRDSVNSIAVRENVENMDWTSSQPCSSNTKEVPSCDKDLSSEAEREAEDTRMVEVKPQYLPVLKEIKSCEQDPCVAINYVKGDSEDTSMGNSESNSSIAAGDNSLKHEVLVQGSETFGREWGKES